MGLPVKWINHIEAWQSSGLKQSAYCQQQGLNYKTFAARLSDYRKAQQALAPVLIPVQVVKPPMPPVADSIVLTHRKGHRLALPVTVSAPWLAELLQCLD
jgi:hypothetical protein